MAKYAMISMVISAVFLIEIFLIPSINGLPIIFMAFPIDQETPMSLSSLPTTAENVKRVHRRDVQILSVKNNPAEEFSPEDDLETAAGTNLLRPLFVYRQQMAYRDRNSKRLAERRRAIPDIY